MNETLSLCPVNPILLTFCVPVAPIVYNKIVVGDIELVIH
jgi:hypothetical protein